MCTDCRAVGVRIYLEGVGLCDGCADSRIARHTGRAPLPELPSPLELAGPDGRRHRFAYRAMRVATGTTVSLEESGVAPGEGYQFEVLGTHDANVAELAASVRTQAEAGIAQMWLEQATQRPGWALSGDEVRGRLVYNDDGGPYNVVIDGRTLTWEEFGKVLESFEGWAFRLVIEDRGDDLRPEGYDEIIEMPDHVILPAADDR